jgi:hydrogenase nickel incorporation protein HypB
MKARRIKLKVIVAQKLLQANEEIAGENRHLLARHGVLTLNLISAPGAGKTTLLEKTIAALKEEMAIGVIEGDIYTTKDAERIASQQVEVVQINTHGACHLDAQMTQEALNALSLAQLDLLFIENVGNLVCPAEFDLGENYKVALLSITEGSDKPAKYPLVFHEAQAVILNKIDLLHHMYFDLETMLEQVKKIKEDLIVFPLSAKTSEGMGAWLQWLKSLVPKKKKLFATTW